MTGTAPGRPPARAGRGAGSWCGPVEQSRDQQWTGQVVVMSGWGRGSDWYRNVQAHPVREVVVGRRSFVPVHRDLTEDEAVAALAGYEHRNQIAAPFVRRVLSRLAGWRYDGSDESRRRLAGELPLIMFWSAVQGSPA